MGRKVTAW